MRLDKTMARSELRVAFSLGMTALTVMGMCRASALARYVDKAALTKGL